MKKMTRNLLAMLLLFMAGNALAQTDTLVQYFDEKGKECKPRKAVLIRKTFKDKEGNHCVNTFAENKLPMGCGCFLSEKMEVPAGEWTVYKSYYWNDDNAKPEENVVESGAYINGKKTGNWKYYTRYNRHLQRDVNYVDGEYHGDYKRWDKNGRLVEKGTYDHGKKMGEWLSIQHGKKRIGSYNLDTKIGEWKEFYPSGNIRRKYGYTEGKPDGLWQTWYDNGVCSDSGYYDKGSKQGEWVYHYESGQQAASEWHGSNKKENQWWDEDGNPQTFTFSDATLPEFKGGERAMMDWIMRNVEYPNEAMEKGIQGTVYVSFTVDTDGSIMDPVVMRSPDPSLTEESLRVVRRMPKWTPAKVANHPARVKFTLPIGFRLG